MKDRKFTVRRRMAKVSFTTIVLSVFIIIAACFFGGNAVSANFREASGILISLFGFLTTIVLGYLGSVAFDDHNSNKTESQ